MLQPPFDTGAIQDKVIEDCDCDTTLKEVGSPGISAVKKLIASDQAPWPILLIAAT